VLENGTVYVYNGTYIETLNIHKTLDLIGENKNSTIIDGCGNGDVLHISSDYVHVSNFTIQNQNKLNIIRGIDCDAGIDIRSNYNIIESNRIMNNYCGVFLYGYWSCDNNIISDNTFSNNTVGLGLASSYNNEIKDNSFFNDGFYVEDTNNNTVYNNTVNRKPLIYLEYESNKYTDSNAGQVILIGCENITIQNSDLSNTTVGIELIQTNNSWIQFNSISNNLEGIITFYSNENTIIQNNICSNGIGGVILNTMGKNNVISNNTILLNEGYGIYLWSSNNTITNNNISLNDGKGIFLDTYCYSNTISENTIYANNRTGIFIKTSSNDNLIFNNIISNNMYGIIIESSSNNTILSNNIYLNSNNGIQLNNSDFNILENNTLQNNNDGIYLHSLSNNNSINQNHLIDNNQHGIMIENSYNSIIHFNRIENNPIYGILLNCDKGTVTKNTIANNGIGLFINGHNNTIYNNNIRNNTGNGIFVGGLLSSPVIGTNIINNSIINNNDFGICLCLSNNGIVSNNIIKENNGYGIHFISSNNNLLFSNNIMNNNEGVHLETTVNGANTIPCENNTFYHNNFINNIKNANTTQYLCSNIWDNESIQEGNYWDDYNGPDANGNGTGDIPYNISGLENQDLYPFIEENGWLKTIDIDQDVFNRGFPIRYTADGDWAAAQNFIPTKTSLTRVDIYIRKFGTPEFNLTIELRQNTIDGSLIETKTITPEELDNNWNWIIFDLTDIQTTPGTQYFIKCPLAPSGITTSFGYEWGYAFGNQYDNGAFWFTRDGGGLWRDLPTMYEFVFRTYGYD